MINLNSFIKQLLLISILVALLLSGIGLFFNGSKIHNPYSWYIFGYFNILSLVTYWLVESGIKKSAYDSYNYIMLSNSIRLLLSAVVLFLYFYFIKTNMLSFIVNFFLMYFIYTFFEVKSITQKLNNSQNNTK